MQFSPTQRSAITATNPNILVSAAAGSGKTAVMVERILHQILEHGKRIDRMLIVTFTRAAAGELRERLEQRFILDNSPHLFEEINRLPYAQISTLHAYCAKLVKKYFVECQIQPQFRMLDENAKARLFHTAKEETLEWLYETGTVHTKTLVATFSEYEISQMLDLLYNFVSARANPETWLQHQTTQGIQPIENGPLGQVFRAQIKDTLSYLNLLYTQYATLLDNPALPSRFFDLIHADGEAVRDLETACQGTLDEVIAYGKKFALGRAPRVKVTTSDEEEAKEQLETYRKSIKESVNKLFDIMPQTLFSAQADMEAMQEATVGLCEATLQFWANFRRVKLEENAIDYADLEHFSIALLNNETIRKQEADRFDCIFVDEYQDISELQSTLLESLRKEEGQSYFYVGDVKQSIYRFRHADPSLFLRKLHQYSEAEDAINRKIILNRNYRSSESVIDGINRVFSHIMHEDTLEIEYDEQQRLYAGLPSSTEIPLELHIMEKRKGGSGNSVRQEAQWTAQRIKELMQNDATLTYRDIVILMPVMQNISQVVQEELHRADIPVYCDARAPIIQNDEIMQLISFLKLMSNANNDIALLSVLRSHLCQFTDSMLCDIRLQKPEVSFYLAMEHVANQNNEEPLTVACKNALAMLTQERFLLQHSSLAMYLWDFLLRSGFYTYYGLQANGKQRQANLRMICQLAKDHPKQGDLADFILSLSSNQNNKADNTPTIIDPWENVVRILSIHQSKGLEFHTVFLLNLDRSQVRNSQSNLLFIEEELGVGVQYQNTKSRTKRKTMLQNGIQFKQKNKEKAEKARLLYVAMTRAKAHLIMVGSVNQIEKCKNDAKNDAEFSKKMQTLMSKTMLDWLLASLKPYDLARISDQNNGEKEEKFSTFALWKTCGESTFPTSFPHKTHAWRVVFHINDVEKAEKPYHTALSTENAIVENLSKLLPEGVVTHPSPSPEGEHLSPLHQPKKLSVTALNQFAKREHLPLHALFYSDELPKEKRVPYTPLSAKKMAELPSAPDFITPKEKNMGVLAGLYTHALLCQLPLSLLKNSSDYEKVIEQTLVSLCEKKIIPPEDRHLCHIQPILHFFQSEIGQRVLQAKQVHREYPFSMLFTLKQPTHIQGRIDLCFQEGDEWVLVDFKTDHKATPDSLLQHYEGQMHLYALGVERISGQKVKECYLYSLSKGFVVPVPLQTTTEKGE